jgi:hypothetical protein
VPRRLKNIFDTHVCTSVEKRKCFALRKNYSRIQNEYKLKNLESLTGREGECRLDMSALQKNSFVIRFRDKLNRSENRFIVSNVPAESRPDRAQNGAIFGK